MLRHLAVGLVGERLVEIGGGDAALEIIGDQEGGNPAQELEATDMGTDPEGLILALCGLGEHVVREPQDGDENPGFQRHFSCPGRRRGSFLLLQNLSQNRLASRIGQRLGNRLELFEILGNGGCGQGQALGNGSSRHFHLA